jgi:iron complex transport system substrate-binding protein
MKKYIVFYFFLLILACNNKVNNLDKIIDFDTINLKYAKGFEIYKNKNLTKIIVKNPWQKANQVKIEYFLVKKDSIPYDFLPENNVIQTPVERIVCFSTTHIGYIDLLEKNGTIVGLAGTENVYNQELMLRINNNEIIDAGNDQNINYEVILGLKPDVVFLYGIESDVSSRISKLNNLGIKTVVVAEYLEETPLAKSEWLKFFALFFDDFEKAEKEFDFIETEYKNLLKITDTITIKPEILINVPFNGVWYLPGGKSYMANYIKDAGGIYPWTDNQQYESFSLGMESIFLKSKDASILINTGIYSNINEISALDNRIMQIDAIKNKKVYNNNKRLNIYGGNDFWESGNVKPHTILKDLILIFHPYIFSQDSLYFYTKLD